MLLFYSIVAEQVQLVMVKIVALPDFEKDSKGRLSTVMYRKASLLTEII